MRKKKISEREERRLATRRERHGPDFDRKNAYHASMFVKTKFNSVTGSAAAKKRWKDYREKKALEGGNGKGGTVL